MSINMAFSVIITYSFCLITIATGPSSYHHEGIGLMNAKQSKRFSWKNLKLRYKIMYLCLFIILLFGSFLFFYIVPLIESTSMQKRRAHLQDVVRLSVDVVAHIEDSYRNEGKSEDEAKRAAAEQLRIFRFGDDHSDYVWINDYRPVMIMHPIVKTMEGQLLDDYRDKSGKLMFVDFVRICSTEGEGFTEYMWQYHDNAEKIVPKLSYVKAFEKWNWVIGAGIYIEDIKAETAALRNRVFAVLGGLVFLSLVLALLIVRSVEKPVYRIIRRLDELSSAGGDLTIRFNDDSSDEMGQMSAIVNTFLSNFAGIIGEVQTAAQNLASAVEQIASGNHNLSQRTSAQASSLEEIAATMEETRSALVRNGENAAEVMDISAESQNQALEGGSLVSDAVASINEISNVSSRIGDIISVINEIAFQTNLLALNAAVEAARAGSQGRGFAVVAAEVRNLALRSAEAAKEISTLIGTSIDRIQDGTYKANRSGEALARIIDSVKGVNRAITDIVSAEKEQQQGIAQVNTAISELDAMTQQNAALVEETASASEELANQARELLSMVSRFKVQ